MQSNLYAVQLLAADRRHELVEAAERARRARHNGVPGPRRPRRVGWLGRPGWRDLRQPAPVGRRPVPSR
jgi:hypothetical protein